MTHISKTYHSRIYLDFKEIREDSFSRVISFYENNRNEISRLDPKEQFELQVDYADALFETGRHKKHLLISNEIIENSIYYNIKYHNGRDIFRSTLFRQAASCYHLRKFSRAHHITKELIKMSPADRSYFLLLFRIHLSDKPDFLHHTRAACVFLCLLAAVCTGVELLLIKNFLPSYGATFETARTGIFLLGIGALVVPEMFHFTFSYLKASNTRKQLLQ